MSKLNEKDLLTNVSQVVNESFINHTTMTSLVHQLVKKLMESSIVTHNTKTRLAQINIFDTTSASFEAIQSTNLRSLIKLYLWSNIVDLTQYDYILVNLVTELNFDFTSIISLLLINNLDDVTALCVDNNIDPFMINNIIELKRMSAFQKLVNRY